MKRLIFPAFFLSFLGLPYWASAQATPTSTFTPICCQMAQTVTSGPGGNFNVTAGLAISGATLFVADFNNNQIQKFNLPSLTSVPGGAITGLTNPYALTTDPQGNLYVGYYGGGVVQKFDTNGTQTAYLPTSGLAMGVAVDTNGDIYVAEQIPGEVQIFQLNGTNYNLAQTITSPVFSTALRGVVKQGNRLYVADYTNSQVFEMDENGPYNFGAPQTVIDSSWVTNPCQMSMDSLGNLYVASPGAGKISVFTANSGLSPTLFSLNHECVTLNLFPQGVAVDGSGNVYETRTGPSGASPWEAVKIAFCPLFAYPTPTPFYQGANPPQEGGAFIYPSPVRGDHATFCYSMAQSGKVKIKVWNQNREVVAEINDRKLAGVQITPLNLSETAPGLYYYKVVLEYDSGLIDSLKIKKFAIVH